jgi:hypothetical protein
MGIRASDRLAQHAQSHALRGKFKARRSSTPITAAMSHVVTYENHPSNHLKQARLNSELFAPVMFLHSRYIRIHISADLDEQQDISNDEFKA